MYIQIDTMQKTRFTSMCENRRSTPRRKAARFASNGIRTLYLGEVEAYQARTAPENPRLIAAAFRGVGEEGHHVCDVFGRDMGDVIDSHGEQHLPFRADTEDGKRDALV